MELQALFALLFIAVVLLVLGVCSYLRPSYFGGDFKIIRTSGFFSIKHSVATNDYNIKHAKNAGLGCIIGGLFVLVVAVIQFIL